MALARLQGSVALSEPSLVAYAISTKSHEVVAVLTLYSNTPTVSLVDDLAFINT